MQIYQRAIKTHRALRTPQRELSFPVDESQ